jgi:glucose/arabinose dehydrogenase
MSRCTVSRCAAVAIVVLFGAATLRAQTISDSRLTIETYAAGFTSPSFFRFLPVGAGDPLEFLICEIGHGRVLHYRDAALVGIAVDLAVAFLFERGLFGIALHPQFATQPYVYLYYSASATGSDTNQQAQALDNRVVRLRWNGTTLDSLQVLLTLPVGPNHNGGALAFGPDGMLYGSIGEAGSTQGQLQNVATGTPPNGTSMIFRLDPDGVAPADNPFYGLGGAMQPVYAYGMRNVFGLDFDPVTGQLWATDNGAATYDEIDRIEPGMNGGWRRLMGPSERDPTALDALWVAPGSSYIDPQFSFQQSFGITAIHFQRGAGLGAGYDGDVFVAAHNSMTVYRFEPTADRLGLEMPDSTLADHVADTLAERDRLRWAWDVGVITDLETGPDGALYILRFSSPSTLYRVTRNATATNDGPRVVIQPHLFVYPNPSRGLSTFQVAPRFVGPGAILTLYSAAGRRIRSFPVGAAPLAWDGRDVSGRRVAAGIYFAALRTPQVPGDASHAVPVVRLE